jgi:hypothetical protein
MVATFQAQDVSNVTTQLKASQQSQNETAFVELDVKRKITQTTVNA